MFKTFADLVHAQNALHIK